MRLLSGLVAIFAVSTALFTVGCGGGGGNSSPTAVNGVWTGVSLPTNRTGDNSTLQADFVQNGTTLSGTAVTTNASGSSIGVITGTVHGNQITAVITTQTPPAGSSAAQRTEAYHGFGMANWYSTSAPIDLSKPISVQVGDVLFSQAPAGTPLTGLTSTQYAIATATLYTDRIYIAAPVPSNVNVQIQYYPYNLDQAVGSKTTFVGTVSGTGITGTYSIAGSTVGTFRFTKTTGATTFNLLGLTPDWGDTYTTGGVTHSIAFRFSQTQDRLTFTGTVGPFGNTGSVTGPISSVTGAGAVVGNNVTLIFTEGGVTTYLTGAYSPNTASGPAITGTALDSTGGAGTFEIEPALGNGGSRKAK